MKVKILDNYLLRQFILSILFGVMTFVLIFVIVDLMENLDDFIDQQVPQNIIIAYYFYFLPEIIRLILPVSILLACLFTVGKLNNFNELTAIKASGISLYRFMYPFIVIGFVISLFAIYFSGWVVPQSNAKKLEIEQKYMKKNLTYIGANIFFQDGENRFVNIGFYDQSSQIISRAGIVLTDDNNPTRLIRRYKCEKLQWDSTKQKWIGIDVIENHFISDTTNQIIYYTSFEFNDLQFRPEDILIKQKRIEEMTLTEIKQVIDAQRRSGNDTTKLEIDFHSLIAFAFANLIVILFGLPFSADKRSGTVAFQFGMNLFFTFIYLAFMKISQSFGKNGLMNPILTAWFANIVFSIFAIVNIVRVRK
ncbi:MAG: LptF/LptG family permease [Ignavibacteria bacterium]|jgi:lipopolysaccharide export system permease protein|nr:LptF/LptG family permease [Ignavibacteria bacterium]MDH7527864.1 LptF/LptG family permease [Ignavibacteria bacterium]